MPSYVISYACRSPTDSSVAVFKGHEFRSKELGDWGQRYTYILLLNPGSNWGMVMASSVVIKQAKCVLLIAEPKVYEFPKGLEIAGCIRWFIFGEYLVVATTRDVHYKRYHRLTAEAIRHCSWILFLFRRTPFYRLLPFGLVVETESCFIYALSDRSLINTCVNVSCRRWRPDQIVDEVYGVRINNLKYVHSYRACEHEAC